MGVTSLGRFGLFEDLVFYRDLEISLDGQGNTQSRIGTFLIPTCRSRVVGWQSDP